MTSYASSHPWEDWAETWAHYLHMADTADTAMSFGVDATRAELASDLFEMSDLWQPDHPDAAKFLDFLNGWVRLTNVLNELSRSMGQPDYYPFVLPRAAVGKLQFVHQVITARRIDARCASPRAIEARAGCVRCAGTGASGAATGPELRLRQRVLLARLTRGATCANAGQAARRFRKPCERREAEVGLHAPALGLRFAGLLFERHRAAISLAAQRTVRGIHRVQRLAHATSKAASFFGTDAFFSVTYTGRPSRYAG